MIKPDFHRRTSRARKKNLVPLSKLRASEVVRTVVDHPRRLEELINLLRDKERSIRGRAATTVARLSESHPGRLVRHVERLKDALADDSAYVRWHLLYALGHLIAQFPARAAFTLADVRTGLGDEDRWVRSFACRALERVAARKPQLIQDLFPANQEGMPPSVARLLPGDASKALGSPGQ